MDTQSLASNEEKVLAELFLKPSYKFHIRELARVLNMNPNTIITITDTLKKEGLIEKGKRKNLMEISLNLSNPQVIQKKRVFNLNQIYSSKIIDFLKEEYNPTAICLIGSYSRGEDLESSDIDIVIFSSKEKVINLQKFEKLFQRKIHLLISNKKMSDEFFNNLINGITIYGAITK